MTASSPILQAALDLPSEAEPSDPLMVRVEGWLYAGARHHELVAVEALLGDRVIGSTALLFPRRDVSAALGIAANAPTGFALRCAAPDVTAQRRATVRVRARFADGSEYEIAARDVPLTGRDYRQGDWGILVDPAFPHLVRREHMYNSGPSQDAPSGELLALLERYLPAKSRVLDVGCGRGPYGEALRTRGYDWFGVEIKAEDCAVLAKKGLPFRQVDGQGLPFGQGEFDAAIAVEVLEHIADPWAFVAEVRRVVRNRFVVSVPNLEAVTYWRSHLAVPWHLLEADHRNFFSRASLREVLAKSFRAVEVVSYGQAPLRTAEGAAVDYHLLAVADV